MNERTRGQIESNLDKAIRHLNVEESVNWISQEQPVSSFESLALGYFLGYSASAAHHTIVIEKMLKRAEKRYKKATGEKLEVGEGKKGGYKLTPKDIADVREMLRRRIPSIMQAVTQGINR